MPVHPVLYDWRHLCLTNWLNRGIRPANVAQWAGNSVQVLLATYVKVIDNEAVLRGLLDRRYAYLPRPAVTGREKSGSRVKRAGRVPLKVNGLSQAGRP